MFPLAIFGVTDAYLCARIEFNLVTVIAFTTAVYNQEVIDRVQSQAVVMPGATRIIDALLRARQKGAQLLYVEFTRRCDNHNVGVTGQGHEGLAAQRVSLHNLESEGEVYWLTAKEADDASPACCVYIKPGKRMMAVCHAVVDWYDFLRGTDFNYLAKAAEFGAGQWFQYQVQGIHLAAAIRRIAVRREQ